MVFANMSSNRSETESGVDKIDTLTGLRGVAALMVAIGHMANQGLVAGVFGHGAERLGVHIFFILSAFLMSKLYLHLDPAENWVRYGLARVGRVFPAYYLIVFLSLLISAHFFWWRYQFNEPWVFAKAVLMIAAPAELWTVPVEVQFYGLFVLFWLAWASGLVTRGRSFLILMIAVLLIEILVTGYYVRKGVDAGGINLSLHVFLLGVASFIYRAEISEILRYIRNKFGLVLFNILVFVCVLSSFPDIFRAIFHFHIPNTANPLPVLVMFLIFQLALRRLDWFGFLEFGPIMFIGKVSYGFYLLHHLVITWLQWSFPNLKGAFALVSVVGVTLLLATVLYHLLERPMADWLRRCVPGKQSLGR